MDTNANAEIFPLLLLSCKYLRVFISPPLFVAVSVEMSPEDVHAIIAAAANVLSLGDFII